MQTIPKKRCLSNKSVFLLVFSILYSVHSAELPSLTSKVLDEDPSGSKTYEATIHLKNGQILKLQQYRYELQLSPDKKYVAFRRHNNELGLFLADTETGKIERHTLLVNEGYPEIGTFVWSPNSRYVAFTVCNQEKYPKRARLFIRDIQNKTHQKIDVASIATVGAGCYVFDPFWSKDSSKVGIKESDIDGKQRVIFFKPK